MAGLLAALAPLLVALGAPTTLIASSSPSGHGVHHAALTLQATFELQCGRVSELTVGLPRALGARTIRPAAVTVNGRHAAAVRTSQHVVTVTMPAPGGALCDSIGPGRVTVRFGPDAGLVNPTRPGSYGIWLRTRGQTATGRLHIS